MVPEPADRFRVETRGRLQVETPVALELVYTAGETGFHAGGNLWIFYDTRQFAASGARRQDYSRPGSIVVAGPAGTQWAAGALRDGGVVRTLDLYPAVTEFLHALHVQCTAGAMAPGETVRIALKTHSDGFMLPRNAISDFYFGLVEDPRGELTFEPTGDGKYWLFQPREAAVRALRSNGIAVESGPPAAIRVVNPSLVVSDGERTTVTARVNVEDAYGNPAEGRPWQLSAISSQGESASVEAYGAGAAIEVPIGGEYDTVTAISGALRAQSNPVRLRAKPVEGAEGARDTGSAEAALDLYWGDLHGMMFNQRPYEDYFRWARDVARLDFAGGQLFSYLTCIEEVWQRFQEVWRVFDQPGRFVALPSVECGTPPDGSHRHLFLPEVDGLPPIFCEDRPAAHDPKLQARFHPDTIFCEDYRALYKVVHELGGFVHGHFHTRFYKGETLAEIYQKQVPRPEVEEAKINQALRQGARLGIVGGSDTHDSRPGNPHPEPGSPCMPAGLTGVWAERLDRATLFDALKQRRCYATTGQRILLDFRVNGAWMGSEARADEAGRYEFVAEVLGTADVSEVDLLVNGEVVKTYRAGRQHVVLSDAVPVAATLKGAPAYCYVRVRQEDGNKAWSSPVWLH